MAGCGLRREGREGLVIDLRDLSYHKTSSS